MSTKKIKKTWWQPALEIFGKISGWIVTPIVFSLYLGKRLDDRYDTSPWIFLSLTAIAFLISTFGIVKESFSYIKKVENIDHKK